MRVDVRARTDADLDRLVQLAGVVHELDGYPRYLPGDLRAFLATSGAMNAWVAASGAEIVGHVALHPASSAAVMRLVAEVTGQPPERFGVIARLLVSPTVRGRGIGRSLLLTAANEAVEHGLRPMLDVAVHHGPAINLYESSGWVRVGRVTVTFGHGGALDEYVYLGPVSVIATGDRRA